MWYIVAAFVSVVVLYHFVSTWLMNRRMDSFMRVLPTPPGSLPFLGHALQLIGKQPWGKMRKWAEQYGNIICFNVLGQRVVYVNDPLVLKRVLQTNQRNYAKDIDTSYKHFMCLLGSGLVTAEGEAWRKGRMLLSHTLRIDIMDDIPRIAMSAAQRMINKINDGKEVEVCEIFRHVTLQVIGELILSLSPDTSDAIFPQLYLPIVQECNKRVWEPYRRFLPTTVQHFINKRKLDKCIDGFVQERWALRQKESPNTTRPQDITDKCMSQFTKLDRNTARQLRDNVKTLLLAGHETSAALLSWSMYETMANPNLITELRKEHEDVFGRNNEKKPSVEAIKAMKWAPAILRETLRKYSVVPLVCRLAVEDDLLLPQETGLGFSVTIPRGCTVMLGIEGVHHRQDIWPCPEKFLPERFFDMEAIDPYAFIPFINGPRNCLGQHLSLLETQIILSHLHNALDFKLCMDPEKAGLKHDFEIPVAPAQGLVLQAHPRV